MEVAANWKEGSLPRTKSDAQREKTKGRWAANKERSVEGVQPRIAKSIGRKGYCRRSSARFDAKRTKTRRSLSIRLSTAGLHRYEIPGDEEKRTTVGIHHNINLGYHTFKKSRACHTGVVATLCQIFRYNFHKNQPIKKKFFSVEMPDFKEFVCV